VHCGKGVGARSYSFSLDYAGTPSQQPIKLFGGDMPISTGFACH